MDQIARCPIRLLILFEIRRYHFHHLGVAIRECLSHPFVAIQGLIATVFISSEIDLQDVIDLGVHFVPKSPSKPRRLRLVRCKGLLGALVGASDDVQYLSCHRLFVDRGYVIPLRHRCRRRLGRNARESFVECLVEPVLLEGLWMPHAARQFEDIAAVNMQAYCGCITDAFDDVRRLRAHA